MNERTRLLNKITAEDFAVYEAVLYLDGHPDDRDALGYYSEHRDNAVSLREEYARKFGPLTIYDVNGNGAWSWINDPFPWEREGNC